MSRQELINLLLEVKDEDSWTLAERVDFDTQIEVGDYITRFVDRLIEVGALRVS